ncbi:DUF5320 domain-containing protein [Desulfofundulus thermocisternus]|jgi:uncharacterized protein YfcZ (UPF0381/DUF406 family)|uniref:DUF5320 domain-containing protein n=1 Tax=Desulfofundulus thermocisternus TaxID=42471 RepID=UPI0004898BBC|nr:DUF5320 domain-containing protein [Desulfofundulus thermocisternus]
MFHTPEKGHCCHAFAHRYVSRHRDCCCHGEHFHRHFYSREERLARLENYLKELQAEVRAVEEKIKELKG